ncbi:PREDICTED: CD209 antigen-like protein 2 [Hipposideros armiger]|uniref:CD209 antigen-like protein 2 n=1 Tax=Hipposideros armiger TaxID=186990 RepID=A0A8B7THF4_HIPAR|nr:PREDICTED: CD209 antigen-like protein 2 [Hipposideros armiger]
MAQQIGSLEDEDLILSSNRLSPPAFGFQQILVFKTFTGRALLVLLLFSFILFTGLLMAIFIQVSNICRPHEMEPSKQEIYQELNQLKSGLARLCRPCPCEWTFFLGNCYFFSNSQRNWHESVIACQDVGAQLVVIKSAEEQNFLQLQISKSNHFSWIGLSDLKHEGTWHWVDNSTLLTSS